MDAETAAMTLAIARAQLAEAFGRLTSDILPESRWEVPFIVDSLACMAGHNWPKTPPQFLDRGRASTNDQLLAVAVAAEQLAKSLAALNKPAIDLLADEGFLRGHWQEEMLALSVRARRADTSNLPDRAPAGRPSQVAARNVAVIVERAFHRLTGHDPAKPSKANDPRGIGPLMTRVFDILGVEASTRSAMRAAEDIISKRPPPVSKPDPEFRPRTATELHRANAAWNRELQHLVIPHEEGGI